MILNFSEKTVPIKVKLFKFTLAANDTQQNQSSQLTYSNDLQRLWLSQRRHFVGTRAEQEMGLYDALAKPFADVIAMLEMQLGAALSLLPEEQKQKIISMSVRNPNPQQQPTTTVTAKKSNGNHEAKKKPTKN